jgi:hypothetical protein
MIEQNNERYDENEEFENRDVFSKTIRAGKRTYFFDVKETRKKDQFLTITESKKRFHKDGHFYFEKHKIFLYKEDFEKFTEGLSDVLDFIKTVNFSKEPGDNTIEQELHQGQDYTNVSFDDLENVNLEER